MISVCFQGKPFNITVIQVYAPKVMLKKLNLNGYMKILVKEMARVNVDILGIRELRWDGMGEFNSDDHYIYYYGQESLRRNGVAIIVNKSLKCSTWMQSQK